jgi:hypothetical protein
VAARETVSVCEGGDIQWRHVETMSVCEGGDIQWRPVKLCLCVHNGSLALVLGKSAIMDIHVFPPLPLPHLSASPSHQSNTFLCRNLSDVCFTIPHRRTGIEPAALPLTTMQPATLLTPFSPSTLSTSNYPQNLHVPL